MRLRWWAVGCAKGVVVRTDCGDGGDDFTQLQLVEDGGLPGRIETDHQNAHLLLAPQAIEQLRERKTHVGGVRVW